MKQISRMTLLPLAVAVASGGGISPTFAEENRLALEEVVVTARKKEESLMDVPMSITAVSGETMVKMNIQELNDLAQSLPNLTFAQSGAGQNAYVRGQGSGFNIAFEQSVGWFVDGIYGSRAEQFLAPMFDVSSVELLRGPQGTVLGKNIIAGAINIRTARPTEEFEGRVTGMYTDETERTRIEAVVSGGLTDSIRARLAISDTQADGWLKNTHPLAPGSGDTLEQLDEQVIRLSVEADITENLSGFFKAEYTDSAGERTDTGQFFFLYDGPGGANDLALALLEAEGQDLRVNKQAQTIAPCGRDDAATTLLAAACDYRGSEVPFENIEIYNYVADFRYDLDGYEVAFVSGFSEFDQERMSVNDYGVGLLDAIKQEEFEQFSQEIRVTSPGGQFIDWTAGLYYQDSSVESVYSNLVYYAPVGSFIGDLFRDWEQNSETYSAFAETTFNFTETFRFILGARWTEEEKDYYKRFRLLNADDYSPRAQSTSPTGGLGGALDRVTYYLDGTLTGTAIRGSFNLPDGTYTNPLTSDGVLEGTGTVTNGIVESSDTNTARETTLSGTLQYDVGDTQYYLTIAEGYKSGNWNENSRSVIPERFDPEFATSYELGAKFVLADGAAELNTALFYVEYSDLQVSNWTGTRYLIGNAGEAISQGLEVDGRWRINEYFLLSGAIAYLDSRYDELQFGCNSLQDLGVLPGCMLVTDPATGVTQEVQDLAGQRTQFAPEWSGNLALDFDTSLSESLLLSANVNMTYTAEQNSSSDGNPVNILPAATLWNARLGLASADDTWEVALVGRNIFDKRTIQYASSVGTRYPGSSGGIHGLPKTITLQGTWRF